MTDEMGEKVEKAKGRDMAGDFTGVRNTADEMCAAEEMEEGVS